MSNVLSVFSTAAYEGLGNAIAESASFLRGQVEREEFPDGERYYRLTSDVDGRDVALLGGTITDRDTLEIYDLAWAMVEAGARSLTLIMPYFGYSTMERAVRRGEVVMAKSRAHLLSSVPLAACGNRVVLLDLHSEGLPYYFDGHVRPTHLYAKPLIMAAARRVGGENFTIASTDAGRAKWVESLASDLNVDAAFVYKRRIDGRHTKVAGVSAQVQGKKVVIYDDMIRTGGSLLKAAEAYRDAGASEISAIATHGLFPGDSLESLRTSGLIRTMICTDSHPRSRELESDFLQVVSVAGLLGEFLARTEPPLDGR